MNDTKHYPPPWNLKGEGFIIPFLGNKSLLLDKGFIPEEDKKSFVGGLGAIMVVNYESSNVGPYFELLFIPGNFEHSRTTKTSTKKKLYKKITKIYVSSLTSVQEGRLNWAIPKEMAEFTWKKESNKTMISASSKENGVFLEAEITKKFFSFPMSTKLYPISLLQKSDTESLINTKFVGSGKGKIAFINKWMVNENLFANPFSISRISFGLSADEFNIIFPIPEIF
ncbi:MAG: acetoacetate decarboxylase family protein [Leptospiraceae bacterium]|nr:acetoacetate decarboxylase family protein [Leptospiraceae bacterium]MBK7058085.1 acetoacetate decarboxylase family protein [Leptospiraceae bacterium]MBP9161777.1 acetoacetate decarboxylase family protein [Leptospiraceae bacterium]